MRSRIPVASAISVAILFASCVEASATDVYRGLDANASGKAVTAPSQFNFNPDLSTFDLQHRSGKRCYLKFTVDQQGAVAGLPHYTGHADAQPAGHWSIVKPANVSVPDAKTAMSTYARANPGHLDPASCRPAVQMRR